MRELKKSVKIYSGYTKHISLLLRVVILYIYSVLLDYGFLFSVTEYNVFVWRCWQMRKMNIGIRVVQNIEYPS